MGEFKLLKPWQINDPSKAEELYMETIWVMNKQVSGRYVQSMQSKNAGCAETSLKLWA